VSPSRALRLGLVLVLLLAASTCLAGQTGPGKVKMTLARVRHWAYVLQNVDSRLVRDQLVGSHFDLYVLEPVVTEQGRAGFDIAGLIRDIRNHNIRTRGVDPLILAYVDIGQAETWRWYFQPGWRVGQPEWIVGRDPDGWEGCLTVAYWHPDWRDIVIYGRQGRSHLEATLRAGFDGVYLDWVEAFSDEQVRARAQQDGINPAAAMLEFIARLRRQARSGSANANRDYLVVAQNGADLYETNPGRYREVIDAISQEGVWYDGDGGFDDWFDPAGYNTPTNALYPGYTQELLALLAPMKLHLPVFCAEYAQDAGGLRRAAEVYQRLAPAQGFIPYCTRRSLSRLSKTPYPWGYSPRDY